MNGNNATTWFLTLLVTSMFWFAIGLSLGYAIFNSNEEPLEKVASLPQETPEQAPTEPLTPPPEEETPDPPEVEEVIEAPVEPEEEPVWAARHLFIAVNGQWLAQPTKDALAALKPGGIILRDANIQNRSQTFALVQEIKRAVGLGEGLGDLPLIAAQHEGGAVNHLGLANAPNAIDVGRADDESLARKLGQSYAQASIGRGIAIAFAPVLDVYESGSFNPALQARTFGTDHMLVAKIGLAMEEGLRQGGVLPVVKHFPGYGASTYGPDGMLVVLNKDFGGLAKVMYPFNEAVDRNVPGILVGYTAVPALDKEDPKRPAALSPVMVTELLRNQWGYEGVIIADDIAFNPMTRDQSMEQTAVQALAAGCDALVILDPNPERIEAVCRAIEEAVWSGELSRTQLDMSRARLEQWQRKLGLAQPQSNATQARVVPPSPAPQPINPAPTQTPVSVEPETIDSDPFSTPPPPPIRGVEDAVSSTQEAVPEPEVEVAEHVELDDPAASSEPIATVETSAPTPQADSLPIEIAPAENETTAVAKVTTSKDDEALGTPIATPLDPDPINSAPEATESPAEDPHVSETQSRDAQETEDLSERSSIEHTVADGEDIFKVAKLYEVNGADIARWNDLSSEVLEVGSRLLIYLPEETPPPRAEPEVEEEKTTEEDVITPVPVTAVKLTHTVKEDETLDQVADRYRVSAKEITLWNGIESENVKAGDMLTIFVGGEQETEPDASEPLDSEPDSPEPVAADIETVRYVVESGDTLYKIAAKHKTTASLLLELNNLKDPNHVWVGQRLKVPAPE